MRLRASGSEPDIYIADHAASNVGGAHAMLRNIQITASCGVAMTGAVSRFQWLLILLIQ